MMTHERKTRWLRGITAAFSVICACTLFGTKVYAAEDATYVVTIPASFPRTGAPGKVNEHQQYSVSVANGGGKTIPDGKAVQLTAAGPKDGKMYAQNKDETENKRYSLNLSVTQGSKKGKSYWTPVDLKAKTPVTRSDTYNMNGNAKVGKYAGSITYTSSLTDDETQYTANFDPQGGTFSDGSTTVHTITLRGGVQFGTNLPTVTRTGYTFNGWYTSSNGGTKISEQTGMPASADGTNYYAHWTLDTYKITYDGVKFDSSASPSVTNNNPDSYTVETEKITLKDPSRKGYDFIGWTGSNGTTPQKGVTILKGSTGDKTFTANWSPHQYKIEYKMVGHGTDDGQPHQYNIETGAQINYPQGTANGILTDKDGTWFFGGWQQSDSSEWHTTPTIAPGTTGDLTFKASWNKEGFRVQCRYMAVDAAGTPRYSVHEGESRFLANGATASAGDWPKWSDYYHTNLGTISKDIVVGPGDNLVYQYMLPDSQSCTIQVLTQDYYDTTVHFSCDLYYLDQKGKRISNDVVTKNGWPLNIDRDITAALLWHLPVDTYMENIRITSQKDVKVTTQDGHAFVKSGDIWVIADHSLKNVWVHNIIEDPLYENGRITVNLRYMEWDESARAYTGNITWSLRGNTSAYFDKYIKALDWTLNGVKKNKADMSRLCHLQNASEIPPNSTIVINSITPADGYAIRKWAINVPVIYHDGSEDYICGTYGQSYMLKGAALNGFWIEVSDNSYSVAFNANGGISDADKPMHNQRMGKAATDNRKLQPNTYYSNYGTFLGWSTKQDATEPEYSYDGKHPDTLPADLAKVGDTVTLYAVWKSNVSN